MLINKYYLYGGVLAALLIYLFAPGLFKMARYGKARAAVKETFGREVHAYSRKYSEADLKIQFRASEQMVTTTVAYGIPDDYSMEDSVEIYYDKQDPTKAFVSNPYNIWVANLFKFVPFFIVWSAVMITSGIVPKRFPLKQLRPNLLQKNIRRYLWGTG